MELYNVYIKGGEFLKQVPLPNDPGRLTAAAISKNGTLYRAGTVNWKPWDELKPNQQAKIRNFLPWTAPEETPAEPSQEAVNDTQQSAEPAVFEGEVPEKMLATVRQHGLSPLPANKTHRFRMNIRSESSDSLYVVAQRKSSNRWECSCFGWIRHRRCKHLRAVAPIIDAPEFREGME